MISDSLTLQTECRHCGQHNKPERKFCASCGAPLWEPCLACQAMNGAWEKFCGACGADSMALMQAQLDRFAAQAEQVATLRQLCRHREAARLLELMAAISHPRLAPHVERARLLAEELRAEIALLEQQREHHFRDAQESYLAHDYDQAVEQLEKIHRRLRSIEMQALLDQARDAKTEVAALVTDIREAVAFRQTAGLLPRVQRLLKLKPRHEQAQQLAQKLGQVEQRGFEQQRRELLRAAQARLAEHDYAHATRLLEQIQPSVRSADVLKLLEHARGRAEEVAWLTQDLREFTEVDEHLLPLAERLLKLKPNDEQVQELTGRIRRLSESRQSSSGRGASISTASSKHARSFGCPVEAWEGFRRINVDKLAASALFRENRSSFFVACGLALQGLEQAAIQINLVPSAKKNVLSRLASSVLKRKTRTAWGLDLGAAALKAVKLSYDSQQSQVAAETCDYIEYPQLLSQADAQPEWLIKEALQTFLARNTVDDDLVCVSYPGSKTLSRFVKLPPSDEKKTAEMVQFEARRQIPFSLDSVTWDHQTTHSGEEQTAGVCEREVCLLAVRTDEAAQFLFPFQEVKLKVDVLQSAAVALYNAFHYDMLATASPPAAGSQGQEVVALLDLGVEASNVVVCNQQSVWLRSIPVGSNHFNRPIITEFNLTHEQAEQLKRHPARAPLVSKLYQAIQPALDDLLGEVQRSLAYYTNTHRQHHVERLLIVGGGLRQHALLRLIRSGASPGARNET